MLTGADGQLPLPWLGRALDSALAQQRGQALLLQGAADDGALELALAIAQSGLCEQPTRTAWPCGRCASCRLMQTQAHPDLLLLMPEEQRLALRWPIALDKPDTSDDDKARKRPSRQLKIDEVRLARDWVVSTSSRARGKWLVLHPADMLNAHAASALLKTLEEPPAGVQIILSAADPAWLLPTIRSRCRLWRMPAPPAEVAIEWLRAAGVDDAAALLAAAGGRALLARRMHDAKLTASRWNELPRALVRGDAAALAQWPLAQAIDALQRLCHDLQCRACGGEARYFGTSALPRPGALAPLQRWNAELQRVARHADHPWQEALLTESLAIAARAAMSESATMARAAARPPATLPE